MASLLALTSHVYAEEEFSISITGPDNEQVAPQRPVRPVARPVERAATVVAPAVTQNAPKVQQNNQAQQAAGTIPGLIPQSPVAQNNLAAQELRPANLPANFQTQHTVGPRETIWSIAHRYSAPYNDVNEFQAVASIYRNNRDAFANGDVNQIRRGTTLNIPVSQEMALEQTQTGSDLLSKGTTTLPPLNRSGLSSNPLPQGSLATNSPIGAVNTGSQSSLEAPPSFVARETLLRDINPSLTFQDHEGTDNPDKEIITDEQLAAHNSQLTQETIPTITQSSLDLRAIESLLDKTERNIQTAQKDIYRRLDDNIQRSAQVAKDTATVTAKEEVSELINHYEQVISELQQSNSDLRSSLSKINKQVEQIRGFQMETADSVALLDRRLEDTNNPLTGGTHSSSFESGPIMWVLLIVGVLALLMSIGLFIFKSRMRRQHALANSFDDDAGDYMDEDDLEISSLLAQTPVADEPTKSSKKQETKQTPKEAVQDSGPIADDDGPINDGGMDMGDGSMDMGDDNFDSGFDSDLDSFGDNNSNNKSKAPDFHDDIEIPSPAPVKAASKAAVAGAAVAGAALGAGVASALTHEDEAQAAWDNAASNASNLDKTGLNAANDDWANSLDNNEASAAQVDLGGDGGFGDAPADGGFGGDGGFGDAPADGGFGGDAGFGDAPADGGFGGDAGFGDAPADGGFGGDAGFGDAPADGGFGGDAGFGDAPADGGFGGDGGFGDTGDFGDAGFGNADGFGDDLGGDDAKQFAASMQGAGGNDFPKSNALASSEVIQASANHDDQSKNTPDMEHAGVPLAVSATSDIKDQNQNNSLDNIDFGALADEIDHPEQHPVDNLDINAVAQNPSEQLGEDFALDPGADQEQQHNEHKELYDSDDSLLANDAFGDTSFGDSGDAFGDNSFTSGDTAPVEPTTFGDDIAFGDNAFASGDNAPVEPTTFGDDTALSDDAFASGDAASGEPNTTKQSSSDTTQDKVLGQVYDNLDLSSGIENTPEQDQAQTFSKVYDDLNLSNGIKDGPEQDQANTFSNVYDNLNLDHDTGISNSPEEDQANTFSQVYDDLNLSKGFDSLDTPEQLTPESEPAFDSLSDNFDELAQKSDTNGDGTAFGDDSFTSGDTAPVEPTAFGDDTAFSDDSFTSGDSAPVVPTAFGDDTAFGNQGFTDLNDGVLSDSSELPVDAQDAAEVFGQPQENTVLPDLDAGLNDLTQENKPFVSLDDANSADKIADFVPESSEESDLASALSQEQPTLDNFADTPSELDELSNTFNLDDDHVADLAKEATPQAATEEAKDLASILGTSLEDANLKDPESDPTLDHFASPEFASIPTDDADAAPELDSSIEAEPTMKAAPELDSSIEAEPTMEAAPELDSSIEAEPTMEAAPELDSSVEAESTIDAAPELDSPVEAEPTIDAVPELDSSVDAKPTMEAAPELDSSVDAKPTMEAAPELDSSVEAEPTIDAAPELESDSAPFKDFNINEEQEDKTEPQNDDFVSLLGDEDEILNAEEPNNETEAFNGADIGSVDPYPFSIYENNDNANNNHDWYTGPVDDINEDVANDFAQFARNLDNEGDFELEQANDALNKELNAEKGDGSDLNGFEKLDDSIPDSGDSVDLILPSSEEMAASNNHNDATFDLDESNDILNKMDLDAQEQNSIAEPHLDEPVLKAKAEKLDDALADDFHGLDSIEDNKHNDIEDDNDFIMPAPQDLHNGSGTNLEQIDDLHDALDNINLDNVSSDELLDNNAITPDVNEVADNVADNSPITKDNPQEQADDENDIGPSLTDGAEELDDDIVNDFRGLDEIDNNRHNDIDDEFIMPEPQELTTHSAAELGQLDDLNQALDNIDLDNISSDDLLNDANDEPSTESNSDELIMPGSNGTSDDTTPPGGMLEDDSFFNPEELGLSELLDNEEPTEQIAPESMDMWPETPEPLAENGDIAVASPEETEVAHEVEAQDDNAFAQSEENDVALASPEETEVAHEVEAQDDDAFAQSEENDVALASPEETEVAHEVEAQDDDAFAQSEENDVALASPEETEVAHEVEAQDDSEPSMWGVPQDEFDISNISGTRLNEPDEDNLSQEPEINDFNVDDNTLEQAGFTTQDFDDEPSANPFEFGDDDLDSILDTEHSGDSLPDMDPPNFDVPDDNDALLDSRIDDSDALADMLSDVPADIPEVIVQQSGSKLHAPQEHELVNNAAHMPDDLTLDKDNNIDTSQFDFSVFDDEDQDEQDQNMVAGIMDGEQHHGVDFDKKQALEANDHFVENMLE